MSEKATNIIPVDLSEIDKEILEKDAKIEALQNEREFLITVRRFLVTKVGNTAPQSFPVLDLGISDYILSLLRKSPLEGAAIKLSYAKAMGKTVKEVTNNVGNALTRLKDKGDIESTAKGKSKKAGSVYRLIKKD